MDLTATFVLPPDVVLSPVTDLSSEQRRQFSSADGDYALTRPGLRTQSKIVTAEVAALLREFGRPSTIAAAVIRYSNSIGSDPEETLEQAFPFLVRMIDSHILVAPGSGHAVSIAASLRSGEFVGGYQITHSVQVLEDTEVYQALADGRTVAVKILRAGSGAAAKEALDREEFLLRLLDGTVSPKLAGVGEHEDRKYLITEWYEGVAATAAAAELRRDPSGSGDLLRLCVSVARAYAHLHAQGVIHSDVHPRNVLVDGAGRVRVIDYGLAVTCNDVLAGVRKAPRGGVGYYLDPEFAAARLAHDAAAAATPASEQYSVAAMLYFLFTGFHYIEFSAEKDEMRRQIVAEPPRPFAPRTDPWPEVEAVLARALSKQPSQRFASLLDLAGRLDAVGPPPVAEQTSGKLRSDSATTWRRSADALVDSTVRSLSRGGHLFGTGITAAPTASVNFGASGTAYALYRLSCLRGDASLLSLADIWAARAFQAMADRAAFRNDELEIVPSVVGEVSLYHTSSGVHAVQALISHAMGDLASTDAAVHNYIVASSKPCEKLDLTLGRASTLIGCSLLLDAVSRMSALDLQPLVELGNGVMSRLWEDLDSLDSAGQPGKIVHLGIAHGWAGVLYATLTWCGSAGTALPQGTSERLRELANCAEPQGRGLRWRIRTDAARSRQPMYTSGWCNGSAGYVFLWTEAFRHLQDPKYLILAERAAWNSWEEPYVADSLCCGLAGVAYGLLALYRTSGNRRWWLNAQELGRRALKETGLSPFPDSLYKGTLGVALLVADLDRPHAAAMPMFEREYRSD